MVPLPDKIRIVVVDDHPLFREGVVRTLAVETDFEIVGQGANADEAMQLVNDQLPTWHSGT